MSSNEDVFCVTVPLWEESTRHRWIPCTKGRLYGPLMFLCFLSKPNVEQTVDWPVIRDNMTDIAVMYEFVCICASITKWISVMSKLFSTNVTKMLPTERQIARWKAYNKFFTWGQFWPPGIVVARVCPSVRPSVRRQVHGQGTPFRREMYRCDYCDGFAVISATISLRPS